MAFCTAINCMDGRVQLPVITYLQKRFNAEYVDTISEPGPNKILADQENTTLIDSIFNRLAISVDKHKSIGVAVVGHHDCAGNPAGKDEQIIHVKKSVDFLRNKYGGVEIIGVWVDDEWKVREI